MIGGNEILPLEKANTIARVLRTPGFVATLDDLQDLAASEKELRRRLGELIERAGSPGRCRACNATVFWFRHVSTGKDCPYEAEGITHFAKCPKADEFRRART